MFPAQRSSQASKKKQATFFQARKIASFFCEKTNKPNHPVQSRGVKPALKSGSNWGEVFKTQIRAGEAPQKGHMPTHMTTLMPTQCLPCAHSFALMLAVGGTLQGRQLSVW